MAQSSKSLSGKKMPFAIFYYNYYFYERQKQYNKDMISELNGINRVFKLSFTRSVDKTLKDIKIKSIRNYIQYIHQFS